LEKFLRKENVTGQLLERETIFLSHLKKKRLTSEGKRLLGKKKSSGRVLTVHETAWAKESPGGLQHFRRDSKRGNRVRLLKISGKGGK